MGYFRQTNGTFYGTTLAGGTSNACSSLGLTGCGTVFALSVGLGPFVETLPTSGKPGSLVEILGTNLNGWRRAELCDLGEANKQRVEAP